MPPKAKGEPSTAPSVSPTMVMVLEARALEARLEIDLTAIGLSMRRFGLLGHLSREPGISFSALARRAGIKVQSLHPLVKGLVDSGLVTTVGDVGQGRAAVIELTPAGAAALKRGRRLIERYDRTEFADGPWKLLGSALTELGKDWARAQTPDAPE